MHRASLISQFFTYILYKIKFIFFTKIAPINDTFLYVYLPDIFPQFNILFLMQKGFKSKVYVMENSMCYLEK